MQDEALSTSGSESRRGRRVLAAIVVLVALYFGITWAIRLYVSEQIAGVIGRQVPEFSLVDRSGRRWTSADLLGRKTLLNFFRSHCPSCRKEREAIRTLAAESGETGVRVLSVMLDGVEGFDPKVTRATLDYFGYEHPVLMADKAFVDAFHGAGWAHVTPVTYVIDDKGVVKASLRGHQRLETLRAATR